MEIFSLGDTVFDLLDVAHIITGAALAMSVTANVSRYGKTVKGTTFIVISFGYQAIIRMISIWNVSG